MKTIVHHLAFDSLVPGEVRQELRVYLSSILQDAISISSSKPDLHALDVLGALKMGRKGRKVLLGTGRVHGACVGPQAGAASVVKFLDGDGWSQVYQGFQ